MSSKFQVQGSKLISYSTLNLDLGTWNLELARRMEITQLEFFLKVIEERSFSKAAERVFRTQPAVSLAIRRLEEEVGAPLFDRSEKTPTLTDVGQVVYEYAQRIVALRDQARGAVAELRAPQRA